MGDYKNLLAARGINVSRETADRFTVFEQVFHKWARKINLVAASTKADFLQRHMVDSAQLYRYLEGKGTIVDLGSGGGFPGVILAIMAANTGRDVHLVESNHKKAAFLRTALHACGVQGQVHADRIEATAPKLDNVEWVTARALAPLVQLLAWTELWTKQSTGTDGQQAARLLLPKGRNVAEEIAEARSVYGFDLIEHASIVDSESCILEISQIQRGAAR